MTVVDVSAAPVVTHYLGVAAGYELGVGRTVPTAAALLGLVSVIIGGLALARSRHGGTGRAPIMTALTLGPISVLVGAVHGANAAGGPGTGNGVVGAIVAVALGLLGTVLGALVLARSSTRDRRRIAPRRTSSR